jgi:hypothetical protein
MPCNAIATATAAVSNEELMKHVDMAALKDLLIDFLREKGVVLTSARHTAKMVSLEMGHIRVSVNQSGAISVKSYGRRGRVLQDSRDEQALADEIKVVLLETAGVLFQAEMIEVISATAPVLGQELIPTEIGDAVMLTVNLNGNLSRVIVLPNGEISVYTDEGTFEDGVGGIKLLFESLAATVTFASTSEPEQHRHDGMDKVHEYLHARHHAHEQDGRSHRR